MGIFRCVAEIVASDDLVDGLKIEVLVQQRDECDSFEVLANLQVSAQQFAYDYDMSTTSSMDLLLSPLAGQERFQNSLHSVYIPYI